MIDSKEKLGETIRNLRKEAKVKNPKNPKKLKKMSLDNLGDIIGKDKHTISGWETGDKYPPLEMIVPLANALGCSPEHLLGIDEHKHRKTSEIAIDIPLSEVSIELLTDLKSECDKYGKSDPLTHDNHLTQLIVDLLTASLIETGGSGINKTMLPLMREYIDVSIMAYKYGGLLERDQSEEHANAKWKAEKIQEKIGEELAKIICDQLSLYADRRIRLTDRERWVHE